MADIKTILSRLLKELDDEEKNELLDSLKNRKLTGDELVAAIKELPPESRAEVRAALAEVTEDLQDEEEKKKPKPKSEETGDEDDDEDDDAKPKSKARIRPGRKSGRAYGWWIDDDGEVVKLDIARVYSGPDEPDEVELFPRDENEDDDDEEDVA